MRFWEDVAITKDFLIVYSAFKSCFLIIKTYMIKRKEIVW